MKNSVISAALLLLMAIPAWAGSDEEQLTALLNEFLAGASANEVAAHERFWAEDLVYTSSRGARFGKADILEDLNAEPESGSSEPETVYSAEDVRIRLYGGTAVVAFRLLGDPGADNGKVMGQRSTQQCGTGAESRNAGNDLNIDDL